MPTVWFVLIAFIVTMYVLLDGFDLGAGAVYPFITKDAKERQAILKAILPVWDGNETWLVAAGGALFLAFPLLYASSLSGLYLGIFIVLWLLVLRGVGIEMRDAIDNDILRSFWDGVFFIGSLPLPFMYGVALANVMRGVPLKSSGYFFQSLWINPLHAFSPDPGIIDWYTTMIGLLALAALIMHGCTYLMMKTRDGLRTSSRILAGAFWLATAGLTALATPLTFYFLPQRFNNFETSPWGFIFPAVALGGLLLAGLSIVNGWEKRAFTGSCGYIIGMISSTAFSIYPRVLPAREPQNSLTIHNAATAHHPLVVGFIAWIVGLAFAVLYFGLIYRMFRGKVEV